MRALKPLFFAPLLLLLTACGQQGPALEISDAYVRAPVPGQSVGAGFLTLSNRSQETITLTGVRSPVANSAEIHEHRHDNGTMRMRQLPSLDLAAGQQVQFKPGGLHVMLFGMEGELPETTRLVFISADGREFSADVGIRRP